jgi:uncharacterized membrane protein
MTSPEHEMSAVHRGKRASRRRVLLASDVRRLVIFALALCIVVPTIALLAGGFRNGSSASWRPGLDFGVFVSAPLSTRIHAISILVLVAAGWGMIALPKGDRRHKTLGWIWICAMGAMGAASLTIPHGNSWVAAYVGGGSAYALLAYGVYAVKRGDLRKHGRTMAMLMIALVLMTLLSLIPGRLMHDVVFGG